MRFDILSDSEGTPREDGFGTAVLARDCSILECVCGLNRKEAGALSRYVLFNAAKLNKAAEKIVLQYYGSLEGFLKIYPDFCVFSIFYILCVFYL